MAGKFHSFFDTLTSKSEAENERASSTPSKSAETSRKKAMADPTPSRRSGTYLTEDVTLTGDLVYTGTMEIEGQFKGTIQTSGELKIGKQARIDAVIEAGTVEALGKVEGDMIAERSIDIRSTATIRGDLTAPELSLERGCNIQGQCTTQDTQTSSTPASETAAASSTSQEKVETEPTPAERLEEARREVESEESNKR